MSHTHVGSLTVAKVVRQLSAHHTFLDKTVRTAVVLVGALHGQHRCLGA